MAVDIKRRDEIRSGLSGRLLELFDSTWAAAPDPDPDPDDVLLAAQQVFDCEKAEAGPAALLAATRYHIGASERTEAGS